MSRITLLSAAITGKTFFLRKTWEYDWSSAQAHTCGRNATAILNMDAWRRIATTGAPWKKYLAEKEDGVSFELIRARTNRSGR